MSAVLVEAGRRKQSSRRGCDVRRRPPSARPCEPRHVPRAAATACQVGSDQPSWELTERGTAVALALVLMVMGTALGTGLAVLWSISSAPV